MVNSRRGFLPVEGSEREPVAGSRVVGKPDPDEMMSVTLVMRPRQALPDEGETSFNLHSKNRAEALQELQEKYGLSSDDLDVLKDIANQYHLAVEKIDQLTRTVVISGKLADMENAFNVQLKQYQHGKDQFRGRLGSVYLPRELGGMVEAVLGLDNRDQAQPHFQAESKHAAAQLTTFTPVQLAKLYNFPPGDGKGQCIAIIELDGGYTDAELDQYFADLNLPRPDVSSVEVNGGTNQPIGDPSSADGEVLLDIEVAGAIAPGAKIVVYFAPNTGADFLAAISAAINDTQNNPSVISISWGNPEAKWTKQAMRVFNQVFRLAAALDITVCCASGDQGASDGIHDKRYHVDFPASSPYVLACGGTKLVANNSGIQNEVVWNENSLTSATGGGASTFFPQPSYQRNAGEPELAQYRGRGVPDVAGVADPETGYLTLVDGHYFSIGGTSAVAPLWAGLLALINQQLGRQVGFIHPELYSRLGRVGGFHDITVGDNGGYQAQPGWDACTGFGSPNGTALLNAL